MLVWACMITLVLLSIAAIKSVVTKTPVLSNTERIVEIKLDSILFWKDKAGREHARAQVAEANYSSLHAYYGPLIDSVLKTLKITGSKLDYITAISTESKGRVYTRVDTVTKEGIKYLQYSGNDSYLTLTGNTGPNSFADYTYTDSLITAAYWKRKPFLKGGIWGKKDLRLDAYSLNPNTKIKHVDALKVKGKPPGRFGVGPYLGYGYNGYIWCPSVGVSIQYNLFRF